MSNICLKREKLWYHLVQWAQCLFFKELWDIDASNDQNTPEIVQFWERKYAQNSHSYYRCLNKINSISTFSSFLHHSPGILPPLRPSSVRHQRHVQPRFILVGVVGKSEWTDRFNIHAATVIRRHSLKWVGIEGGLPPFRLKKRAPPTLSSEALLSKKFTKNVRKRAKIPKNAKSRWKEPKIGSILSFEWFLSVFRPVMYKKGSKDTILSHFTPFLLSPWPKNGYPPHPFTRNFPKIPTLLPPLTFFTPPPPIVVDYCPVVDYKEFSWLQLG
jgi:hypothetical protein